MVSNNAISDDTISNPSQQYKSLKQFLDDLFTEQFVGFTALTKRANNGLMLSVEEPINQERYRQNLKYLNSPGPIEMPRDFQKN